MPQVSLLSQILRGGQFDRPLLSRSGDPSLLWDKSCGQILQMWFIQRLHVVGIVGLVIAFLQVCSESATRNKFMLCCNETLNSFQLFGLISSMLIFCTVKHKRKSSKTYKSYSPSVDTTLNRNSTGTYLDD